MLFENALAYDEKDDCSTQDPCYKRFWFYLGLSNANLHTTRKHEKYKTMATYY